MTYSVLFIASGSLWAGAEMQIYTLIVSAKSECKVSAVLFCDGILAEKLRDKNIEVYILDESRLSFIQIMMKFHKILTTQKFDIIHTHGYKENILGSFIGLINHIPSIRTEHGDSEFKVNPLNIKKSIPLLLDYISGKIIQKKIISVSKNLAIKLKRKYPEKKICVIQNGLNVDEVVSHSVKHVSLPGRDQSFKIAYVGRLVKLKRVDIIIEAYSLLYEKYGLEYELYVAGEGEQKDSLMQLVDTMKISEGTHFLGLVENIHEVMNSVDCLVMASDHEGLPMTILESMAIKLPVISHSVGDIPYVLDSGRCGYLVHNQNPINYKNAIEKCKSDKDKKFMVDEAYKRVCNKFSHKINAAKINKIYKEVLSST